jgi:hypothetical protein
VGTIKSCAHRHYQRWHQVSDGVRQRISIEDFAAAETKRLFFLPAKPAHRRYVGRNRTGGLLVYASGTTARRQNIAS